MIVSLTLSYISQYFHFFTYRARDGARRPVDVGFARTEAKRRRREHSSLRLSFQHKKMTSIRMSFLVLRERETGLEPKCQNPANAVKKGGLGISIIFLSQNLNHPIFEHYTISTALLCLQIYAHDICIFLPVLTQSVK